MYKTGWFVLSFLSALGGDTLQRVTGLQIEADHFTTDQQGNIYVLKGDEVVKYTQEKAVYRYSNKALGKISRLDAGNGLRILAWYADLNQIVVLDNTLSEHGPTIRLAPLNLEQVQLVAGSANNNLWLYDQATYELIRMNHQLQVLGRSGNLMQVSGSFLEPNYLVERGEYVYLNDPERGILVFDVFGTYYKKIPIIGLHDFQVLDHGLLYTQSDTLRFYQFKTFSESTTPLPIKNVKKVRMQKGQLFIQSTDSIVVYKK